MKQLLILVCLPLLCYDIIAQKTIDVDKESNANTGAMNHFYTVAGNPFVMTKFSRVVSGSPFFDDKLMKGAIILSGGKEYKNILVRVNLLETQVNYYDNKQKIEMVASTPVREVVLWDTINNKDYRFVNAEYIQVQTEKKPEKDFYELLQAGKVELYKQHKKLMAESRPYGSATFEQTIETKQMFYILYNGSWTRIKTMKGLTDMLSDKRPEISKFISTYQLSGDNQQNYEAIVAYYNSLFIEKA
jgi:hypothetical protein